MGAARHRPEGETMSDLTIKILPDGSVQCLWTDEIDLYEIGHPTVRRASTVEYEGGWWVVRLAEDTATHTEGVVKAGAEIAAHKSRKKAIELEVEWLVENALGASQRVQCPSCGGEGIDRDGRCEECLGTGRVDASN